MLLALSFGQIAFADADENASPSDDETVAAYKRQLEANPDANDVRLQLAELYRTRAQWHAALAEYREVVQRDDHCVPALRQMGDIYLLRLSQPHNAIDVLERAVALAPEDASVWRLLGVAYFRLNRLDEAIYALRKTLALHPADTYIRYTLGVAFMRQNNYDEAVNTFREIIATDRYYAKAYFGLSQCHERRGEHELAQSALSAFRTLREQEEQIETCRLILARDPTDIETRLRLAHLYIGREDLENAATVLEPCGTLAPEDPRVEEAYAVLFVNAGDYTRAAERYRKLVQAHPHVAAYHNGLGVAYLYLGNYPLAIARFKEAIRLEPTDKGYYQNLIEAYRRSGDLIRADETARLLKRQGGGSR